MATKRMLIDSSHTEETRVVVASGHRLEEFDFETSTRKQLKGNIYLAKVMRVEPSLQAAFVDYGGNRHGFLPFSEIHPDYYQIPLADREALFREQEAAEAAQDEADRRAAVAAARRSRRSASGSQPSESEARDDDRPSAESDSEVTAESDNKEPTSPGTDSDAADDLVEPAPAHAPSSGDDDESAGGEGESDSAADTWRGLDSTPPPHLSRAPDDADEDDDHGMEARSFDTLNPENVAQTDFLTAEEHRLDSAGDLFAGPDASSEWAPSASEAEAADPDSAAFEESTPPAEPAAREVASDATAESVVESDRSRATETAPRGGDRENGSVEDLGGDEIDDLEHRRVQISRSLLSRRYKIQEVIKKRQIMLVQVVKEERGTKGAALTTYLSLAGRYCVLMPNAIRGGGISRKIVNAEDRRRLKAITSELELPSRMGVIVRTAGMNRTRPEIKRDFEYLLRQWESIRELTLRSTAPCLIYGEANLIRRSIRDLYAKDIDEILVEGDEGYRIAKDFMRTLIPSHTAKVQPYRDRVPLFVRFQVESQLDSMYSPQVQLKSGGYLVINQTEALVAIDVNSGRATRERNIEETATRTNLEAADELARQLRLRDLAGLIVIDFIDMEESRNQRAVERRLKDALKNDRARIQVGRISPFGLLEMSRQRLRPSLAEASMETCPSCGGAGLLRSTESAALHVLRAIEEEGLRGRSAEIRVHVPTRVALYVLNNKRQALADIEARYSFVVGFVEDNTLISAGHEVERVRTRTEAPPEPKGPEPITALTLEPPELVDEEVPPEAEVEAEPEPIETTETAEAETAETGISRRRRRRRRGRPEGVERGHMRQVPGEAPSAERELQIAAPEVAERDEMEIAAGESLEPAATHARERPAEGEPTADDDASSGGMARRRRRGRRGGRRRRGRVGGLGHGELESAQPTPIDGEPSETGAPAEAAEAETHGESDDRARRHRRRGRRGRGGIGPGAGEDSTWRSKPRGETHAAVDDMGPKAADSSIAAEPSARYEPVAAEPRADHQVAHHAAVERSAVSPAEASKERRPVPQPSGDEEPAQPDGPPRRGWWQRVLTGR